MLVDFSKWVFNRFANLVGYDPSSTDLFATNTQAAIDELANRHFGKNYAFVEKESETTSVLVLFSEVVNLNPNVIVGADYKINWSCEALNSSTKGLGLRLQLNNNTDLMDVEPGLAETNKWYPLSGSKRVTFSNSSPQIDLDLRSIQSGKVVKVRNVLVDIWRVT